MQSKVDQEWTETIDNELQSSYEHRTVTALSNPNFTEVELDTGSWHLFFVRASGMLQSLFAAVYRISHGRAPIIDWSYE